MRRNDPRGDGHGEAQSSQGVVSDDANEYDPNQYDPNQYRSGRFDTIDHDAEAERANETIAYVFMAGAALILASVCVAAYLFVTGPSRPSDEYVETKRSTISSASASDSGETHWMLEWLQFNRGRKDGESADNWIYANCRMAAATADFTPTAGAWKSFDKTLSGGQERPAKTAAEIDAECRAVAKQTGGVWVQR